MTCPRYLAHSIASIDLGIRAATESRLPVDAGVAYIPSLPKNSIHDRPLRNTAAARLDRGCATGDNIETWP